MEFIKEEFTEEELILLRMAFRLLDVAVEEHYGLDYSDYRNVAFELKEKLGIYEIVS